MSFWFSMEIYKGSLESERTTLQWLLSLVPTTYRLLNNMLNILYYLLSPTVFNSHCSLHHQGQQSWMPQPTYYTKPVSSSPYTTFYFFFHFNDSLPHDLPILLQAPTIHRMPSMILCQTSSLLISYLIKTNFFLVRSYFSLGQSPVDVLYFVQLLWQCYQSSWIHPPHISYHFQLLYIKNSDSHF